MSQAEQRKDDEKRDAQWMEQLCAVADLTVSIREVLDQLELAATETVRRDEAMAKRDEAMRDLVRKDSRLNRGQARGGDGCMSWAEIAERTRSIKVRKLIPAR